mmetsp:Transcript_6232/g.19217  ORF Transcript_6232/g.19217 Transcript_6232/m.19217 type:complete len:223 (-) Transcript_6232:508-1176(-)
MCARSTWQTHLIVASRSGASSVELTNMVPVELRVRASVGFDGTDVPSAASCAASRAAARAKAWRSAFSSAKLTDRSLFLARPRRRARPPPPAAAPSSPRQASVCGLSDRRRVVEWERRVGRAPPPGSSSKRKLSSTVESVRMRAISLPSLGRRAGGRQPGPDVGAAAISAEFRPASKLRRMLRSISSKKARRSACVLSSASRSAAPWSSRGLTHCVSRVRTS